MMYLSSESPVMTTFDSTMLIKTDETFRNLIEQVPNQQKSKFIREAVREKFERLAQEKASQN